MSTIIYGTINANGSIQSGSGFEVVHDDTGEYTIVYSSKFGSQPSVVATQNYPSWTDFNSNGGKTTDNCTVVASNNSKVKIKTGDSNGNSQDRNFNFISIGN